MVLAILEPLDFAAERRQLAAAAAAAGGWCRDGRQGEPLPRPGFRSELARRVVDRVMAALAGALGKDYVSGPGSGCRQPRVLNLSSRSEAT
jgi:hypothetical protein